jgi:hypothetical protein
MGRKKMSRVEQVQNGPKARSRGEGGGLSSKGGRSNPSHLAASHTSQVSRRAPSFDMKSMLHFETCGIYYTHPYTYSCPSALV